MRRSLEDLEEEMRYWDRVTDLGVPWRDIVRVMCAIREEDLIIYHQEPEATAEDMLGLKPGALLEKLWNAQETT